MPITIASPNRKRIVPLVGEHGINWRKKGVSEKGTAKTSITVTRTRKITEAGI